MKNNVLEYKGYHTKVEFDSEDLILRGKIEGIGDFVDFECEDVKDVEKEFHEAVDDYLEFCKEMGKEPDKEYRGMFNVRISPELHKKLAVVSMRQGETLNASVEKAIQQYVTNAYKEGQSLGDTIIINVTAEDLKAESIYRYDAKAMSMANFGMFDKVKMQYSEEKLN